MCIKYSKFKGAVVECEDTVGYSAEGHRFESGLSTLATGYLSVDPAINLYLYRIRKKDKAERSAPHFICCSKGTVGLLPPLPL